MKIKFVETGIYLKENFWLIHFFPWMNGFLSSLYGPFKKLQP